MKVLKWILISLVALVIILYVAFKWVQSDTKKHSPEDTVAYTEGDLRMEVYYNRPFKKEREIFGGLVPYGEVWRTGANEATTFMTNQNLLINGKELPAGKYTLWTIPGSQEWMIIFNRKMYRWGVGFDQQASREPEHDVLRVTIPAQKLSRPVEQFTISFNDGGDIRAMTLEWDKTRIDIPIKLAN